MRQLNKIQVAKSLGNRDPKKSLVGVKGGMILKKFASQNVKSTHLFVHKVTPLWQISDRYTHMYGKKT